MSAEIYWILYLYMIQICRVRNNFRLEGILIYLALLVVAAGSGGQGSPTYYTIRIFWEVGYRIVALSFLETHVVPFAMPDVRWRWWRNSCQRSDFSSGLCTQVLMGTAKYRSWSRTQVHTGTAWYRRRMTARGI